MLFTAFHLSANYRAVRVVTMETLNKARLHLLVTTYLIRGTVPSVREVNNREPILLRKCVGDVHGSSISESMLQHQGEDWHTS